MIDCPPRVSAPLQKFVRRSAALAIDGVRMASALERIAELRDEDGNAAELSVEQLRAIARDALSPAPFPRR